MKLVSVSEFGIKGINYYWVRKDMYGITEDELKQANVTDDKAYVDESLIPLLEQANATLKEKGYELIVKDAYRSPELYQLVKNKRYSKFGKEQTDKILNTVDMPHSNGRTIDVALVDATTGQEVSMRNKKDDPDNFFINYYKDMQDSESQEYQRLQDLLVQTMLRLGFKLGSKNEFWHFELPA